MQRFRRFLAALASLVVGASSFALSFVALRDVSVEVGAVPVYLGFLVPIVIDGGIICGSAVIWSLSKETDRRPIFPFLFVGSLVVVSVVVNTNHAGPGALAKGIAALPPLILLGTLELVAAQGRRQSVTKDATRPESTSQAPQASEQPLRAAQAPVEPVVQLAAPAQSATPVPVVQAPSVPDAATPVVPATSTPEFTPVSPASPAPQSLSWVDTTSQSTTLTSPGSAPVAAVVNSFGDAIDGELEHLVETYGDGQARRSRPAATRRPVRVRAEEPLG
jgi:hypothetical protein